MSSINTLISDLVRAANEVEKIGDSEICRLIKLADVAIRNMRVEIGIPPSPTARDALIEIYMVAEHLCNYDHDQISAALLEAAGMIRDLHIVLHTGTAIRTRESVE